MISARHLGEMSMKKERVIIFAPVDLCRITTCSLNETDVNM